MTKPTPEGVMRAMEDTPGPLPDAVAAAWDDALEYTREELQSMRRASHNLQRVAAIMRLKFGEDDGLSLLARGLEALIMEQFRDHTSVDEKEEIENTLRREYDFQLVERRKP